jgi:hypothetical protein
MVRRRTAATAPVFSPQLVFQALEDTQVDVQGAGGMSNDPKEGNRPGKQLP